MSVIGSPFIASTSRDGAVVEKWLTGFIFLIVMRLEEPDGV